MNIIPSAKNSQKPATIALSILAFGIISFVTLMTPSLIYPEVRASAAESADENVDTDTTEQPDDIVSEADSNVNNPDATSNTSEPANTSQDDTTSDSTAQANDSNSPQSSATQDQDGTNESEQQIAQTDAGASDSSPTADMADGSTKNPDADPAGNMPGNGENQSSDKEGILQPDGPLGIDHSLAGGGLAPLQPTDSSLSDGENAGRVE